MKLADGPSSTSSEPANRSNLRPNDELLIQLNNAKERTGVAVVFRFHDGHTSAIRQRPLEACSTVQKLFGQAVVGGIIPSSTAGGRILQARADAYSMNILEGDQDDFAALLELLKRWMEDFELEVWEDVEAPAICVVDVRAAH